MKICLTVSELLYADRQEGRHGNTNRHITATFHYECAIKYRTSQYM
jgi:hypothetical protein